MKAERKIYKQILKRTDFHYCLRKPDNPVEGDMWNDPVHGSVIYTRNRSKLMMFSLENIKFISPEEEIRAEAEYKKHINTVKEQRDGK